MYLFSVHFEDEFVANLECGDPVFFFVENALRRKQTFNI